MSPLQRLMPMIVAFVGVGFLALMDAFMKGASLAAGAYTASLLRSLFGLVLIAPVWLAMRPKWPRGMVMRLHVQRGVISAFMGLSWFFALTRLPIAEAIALSFIAPILALYFASILLGEQIRREAIWASVLGFAGMAVIVSGRLGESELTAGLALGLAALAFSAVLYAYQFVVIRRQSQLAGPVEIATFHAGISGGVQLLGAPLLFAMPAYAVLGDIGIAAALTVAGSLAVAWSYARAEAQVLVPMEYTGFLWAALFGWIMFREEVTLPTLVGAALIVTGCWIAARRQRTEQTAI